MKSSFAFILLTSLLLQEPARAEVIIWTNIAGGQWNTGRNWNPNQVPTTNDVATITNDGNYKVTLNVSPVLAGFVLGGTTGTQTVAMSFETITLDGPGRIGPQGRLELSGGLLGTAQLDVEGKVVWFEGTIGSNAVVNVVTGANLLIGTGANYARILAGKLTNFGTVVYTAPGPFGLAGTLHNSVEAIFDIQWNSSVFKSGTEALFVNEGTIRKSAGVATSGLEVPLVHSGTIDVQIGKFVLQQNSVLNDGCRFVGIGPIILDGQVTNTLSGALYSENLLLQDATLTGTGTLNGKVTWGAGYIGSDARLSITTNSELFIGGGANYARILAGSLTNLGTITYASPGPFGVAGVLHNAVGGVFDIQWNSSVFKSGPQALFVNEGTIRKSAGVSSSGMETPLLHSGTIEVQIGIVVLQANSVFRDGSRFVGAGKAILDGHSTNDLSGTLYSENLFLQDTTLTGTGALSGTITWGAGYIGADAKLLLATSSELYIGGGANFARILQGCLTNLGTIVYTSPGPFAISGTLHNAPGGVFDIQWSSTVFKLIPEAIFINEGLLQKSTGVLSDIEVSFLNRGKVNIPAGRLNFVGPFNQPSGDILLLGGNLRSTSPLDLAGGRLLGWGTVEGDLTNSGATVFPTNSGGVITIAGSYVQHLGGNFEVALAGTQPATNHSQLRVTGAAQLNGTITAQPVAPYVPSTGDAYTVMTFASRRGDYARRNGFILLGHNRRLETIYNTTSLLLSTVDAPDPAEVSLQIGKEGQAALVSWPLEFGSGTLYACTNLAQANWAILPTVNNSFLDSPMLPWRWFRLTIP